MDISMVKKAKTILSNAIKEKDTIDKLQVEIQQFISRAENVLIYGTTERSGRHQTYR